MSDVSRFSRCIFVASLFQVFSSWGATDPDGDALSLEASGVIESRESRPSTKISIETSIGAASRRYGLGSQEVGRASFDFSHSAKFNSEWTGVFSDRVDRVHPTSPGSDTTINSLREAYLSWQPEGGSGVVELGRINLRYGPGYGYNPTDFFRDGSLRTVTTANPFALRENRLGTVMVRGQRLWADGSLSIAYSPKLSSRPSAEGWNLDLGSTNNRGRALVALGTQFSQRANGQFVAYRENGSSPVLGASGTALLSDAATAHLEWSRGREPTLLSRALGLPGAKAIRNRFTGGATYTTLGKTSVTAEYQYNGFGLSRADLTALASTPSNQIAYLIEAQRRQELVPRQAFLLYLTQKDLLIKDLDLTGFLRVNLEDKSRFGWIELRRHWPSFDLVLQLQQNMGRPTSEHGILPDRRVVQLLGTYYF